MAALPLPWAAPLPLRHRSHHLHVAFSSCCLSPSFQTCSWSSLRLSSQHVLNDASYRSASPLYSPVPLIGTTSYLVAILVNSAFLGLLLPQPQLSGGRQFPAGLLPSQCLSHPQLWPRVWTTAAAPHTWLGVQTTLNWILSGTSPQWLLTAPSKPESKFPNGVLYHSVRVNLPASPPATHDPCLLCDHTGAVLSPWLSSCCLPA